jgi:hypothetical protein
MNISEIADALTDEIERLKNAFSALTGNEYDEVSTPRSVRKTGRKRTAKKTGAKRGRPAGKKTAKKGTGKRGRPVGSKNATKKTTGKKRGRPAGKKTAAKEGHGRMDFPLPGVGSAKGTKGA